jgi:hypothetical protein
MPSLLHTLSRWPGNHPTFFAVILFGLSLYAEKVRKIILLPFTRFRLRIRKDQEAYERNFAFVRGSSYRLILFMTNQFLKAMVHNAVWSCTIFLIGSLEFHIENLFLPAFIGLTMGDVGKMRALLMNLITVEVAMEVSEP